MNEEAKVSVWGLRAFESFLTTNLGVSWKFLRFLGVLKWIQKLNLKFILNRKVKPDVENFTKKSQIHFHNFESAPIEQRERGWEEKQFKTIFSLQTCATMNIPEAHKILPLSFVQFPCYKIPQIPFHKWFFFHAHPKTFPSFSLSFGSAWMWNFFTSFIRLF